MNLNVLEKFRSESFWGNKDNFGERKLKINLVNILTKITKGQYQFLLGSVILGNIPEELLSIILEKKTGNDLEQ
jgi:hypothetical protein